jgi:hypothetical protein
MEFLQMLKFALKKVHLNFTADWMTSEHTMQEQIVEEDLLAALFAEDKSENIIDQIIQNFATDDSDDNARTAA